MDVQQRSKFFKKKVIIDELKTNPPQNSVILSFDEKGKTPVKDFEGSTWHATDHKYLVATKQKVKGIVDYFAAKNIHSGKLYHRFYDWKNAFCIVDFFERLLKEIPDKIIYIILDCWSAHRAGIVQAFAAMNPRLRLVFLPTNASWMNEIERFFSQVERFVLRNSRFQSVKELMNALSSFVTFGALV